MRQSTIRRRAEAVIEQCNALRNACLDFDEWWEDHGGGRYLVLQGTDGGSDQFPAMAGTLDGLAGVLADSISDEWGSHTVFDLQRRKYLEPVTVRFTVAIRLPGLRNGLATGSL